MPLKQRLPAKEQVTIRVRPDSLRVLRDVALRNKVPFRRLCACLLDLGWLAQKPAAAEEAGS